MGGKSSKIPQSDNETITPESFDSIVDKLPTDLKTYLLTNVTNSNRAFHSFFSSLTFANLFNYANLTLLGTLTSTPLLPSGNTISPPTFQASTTPLLTFVLNSSKHGKKSCTIAGTLLLSIKLQIYRFLITIKKLFTEAVFFIRQLKRKLVFNVSFLYK